MDRTPVAPNRRGKPQLGLMVLASLALLAAGVSGAGAVVDDIPIILDTEGNNGRYPSVALNAAGNPVISYTDGDLRLLVCNDADCTGGDDTPVTLDSSGDTGYYTSLALSAVGNPVISYRDQTNGDLRLLVCNDPVCAGGDDTPVTLDSSGNTGYDLSMALDGSDNPVISYHDAATEDLKLVVCNDPNCAGGDDTPITLDSTGDTGRHTSLALTAAGNPVISYYNDQYRDLRLIVCDDSNCAGGNDTPITLDSTNTTGWFPSLALDRFDNPIISYYYSSSGNLKFLACNDPDCSGGDDTPITLDSNGNVGSEPSLVLSASGKPVIAYRDNSNGRLLLLNCNDPACAGGDDTPITLDAVGSSGYYTSLALGAGDNPVIAHTDETNHNLRFLACNDPGCTEDLVGPTATIGLADGQDSEVTDGPVEFSIVFDEPVVGFEASDLVIGGTAGATNAALTGDGANYTATVSTIPTVGTLTIYLPAGAVADGSGFESLETIFTANTVTVIEPDPEPDPEPQPGPDSQPEPEVSKRKLTGNFAGASGFDGFVSRLYMAVFLRQPDTTGHAYWVTQANAGISTGEIATFFIDSPEFINTYSALDNAGFVDLLYLNVMDRTGETAGVQYWNDQLDSGVTRSVVVLQFTESPEFKALTGTN